MLYYTVIESPLDPLLLTSDGECLTGLYMDVEKAMAELGAKAKRDAGPFCEALAQLDAYFAGELQHFDLPLRARGTSFQKSVWDALTRIPYGQTVSYSYIAQQIDSPKAVRAVGLANGRNPIGIIVPCHRVIGASGKLTGYAGGLPRKEWLLTHEAQQRTFALS